jgi:polar amino acid transport system substrate-binding protein
MKLTFYILILSTIFLYINTSSAQTKRTLRVGMELSYPPFEMSNSKNEPEGISVEIAKALAKNLNRPLEIVNMSFDGLIPSLKTSKIDIIISSMTVTSEREKAVDFSKPYVSTGLAILVGKDSKINSSNDLDKQGLRIAVKKGTTAHIWTSKNIQSAQVLLLDKETNAVLEVVQGKADAFLYDQMSVYRNWSKNKDQTRAILEPFQKENWAIALRKNESQLKSEINDFLEDFRRRGEFENLSLKYFAEERKAFEALGVGFIFGIGTEAS